MTRLIGVAFVGSLVCPVSLLAQVNPVNDFSGGVSVLTIGGDATDGSRHTLVGWQASASQKIKSAERAAVDGETPISIVGDFGGQFGTSITAIPLHVYEYMGGIRFRPGRINKAVGPGVRRIDPTSVFLHALYGGTTRSLGTTSKTSFIMGYGGGVDVMPGPPGAAYVFGVRTQFDWLPLRTNSAWDTQQFRVTIGLVFMARYWD
jgi:hypothetical protein